MSKFHYITIERWMVSNLGLRGDELLIYAIIYGFSQHNNNFFTGSSRYLSFWTGKTKETMLKDLKKLRNKGLIARKKKVSNINENRYFCDYYATITRFPEEDQEKVIHNWSKYSPPLFPQED